MRMRVRDGFDLRLLARAVGFRRGGGARMPVSGSHPGLRR
jgi:hypothetical protein